MEFLHHDLGQQKRGTIIRVHLSGNAANVQLLNSSNFSNYKRGRGYRGYGGHAKRSPVDLAIPSSGRWHLAVDLGGYQGRVGANVEILPGPLPPLRQANPRLATIAENIGATDEAIEEDKRYDVFICHASEDKDSIVRPLAHALDDLDLDVWYDEFELRIGDNLRRKIDHGVANSRFGVVVVSPAFFAKEWSQYELDGLVTREMAGGDQIILPIWHEITKEEIIAKSPSLAVKVALLTSEQGAEEIAEEIAAVIQG